MKLRTRPIASIFLLLGLILSGAVTSSAEPILEPCRQSLDQTIRWLRPGAVLTDGVLVVDAVRHQVLKVDFRGVVRLWEHQDPPQPILVPAIVRSTGGSTAEILIEDASDDRIVKFDLTGAYRGQFSFERLFTGRRLSLDVKAAFDWVPYDTGYFGLFAYDTGLAPDAPDERGVVHLREDGSALGPLRTFANTYSSLAFYQRNPGTVAADPAGRFAYFIGPEGKVLRYSDDKDLWASFPVGKPLPRLSDLPHLKYPGAAPRRALEHYREIERSYVLTGLAYSKGSLFLLEKKAIEPGGQASWTLLELNPESGIVTRRQLASNAAHITLLASDEKLVLLEQDGVFGRGPEAMPEKPVSSMIVIPVNQLTSLDGKRFPDCGHAG